MYYVTEKRITTEENYLPDGRIIITYTLVVVMSSLPDWSPPPTPVELPDCILGDGFIWFKTME